MDIKAGFSLAIMAVFSAILALFAVSVYDQVKDRVLLSAENTLASDMDREWRHLQSHRGRTSVGGGPASQEIFYQLFREDKLISDSLPHSLKNSHGELSPLWSGMISRSFSGSIDDKRFELVGYYDLRPTERYLSELHSSLMRRGLLALLVIAPLSWFLAKILLKPFRSLSKKTSSLEAKNLSFRFPDPSRSDEYGDLIRSFNKLLSRLEGSFEQLRRFATNASHELRTPLTVIRGEAEWLLHRPRDAGETKTALEKILDRATGIQQIISRLLFFADMERLKSNHSIATMNVTEKVNEVVSAFEKSHGLGKKVAVPKEDMRFTGPTDLISSVITNVIENALKYSYSKVVVDYTLSDEGFEFKVADDGPGIPTDKREIVFEPFSKLQDAGEVESHGLGLSILKACVEAARGKMSLSDSDFGGLLVSVWFPAV